jgi:hypothetical protein
VVRSDLDDRLGIACCLEVLGEAALGRAQLARAARLLGAAAIERAALGAPVPPVDGERAERLVTALAAHRGAAPAEGTVSAVVAAELREHLPRPNVRRRGPGA